MEVAHGELEDVRLLQLGDVLALGLESHGHDVFQLVQALVDPGSPLPLEERLCYLLVLMSS